MKRIIDRILGKQEAQKAYLPEYVSNQALTFRMIPAGNASWQEIAEFALTFDGYQKAGSFNRCTLVDYTRNCNTLSEMRACLFFEIRRWSMPGQRPDKEAMDFIRSLLDRMREKVRRDERE